MGSWDSNQDENKKPVCLGQIMIERAASKASTHAHPIISPQPFPQDPVHSESVLPAATSDALVPQSPSHVNACGRNLYRLELIGKGGTALVHKVVQLSSGHIFALKSITGVDRDDWGRFTNEIAILRALQGNRSVVGLIDVDLNQSEKAITILMEYGESDLGQIIASQQHLHKPPEGIDPYLCRWYWRNMLEAVACVHRHGIIHGNRG